MNVHVDGVIFSLQKHGGITVYFRELLQRLVRDEVSTTLTLEGATKQAVDFAGRGLVVSKRDARLLERYRRCRELGNGKASVFHSTYYRRPEGRSISSVVTVYDFTYERFVGGPRKWIHAAQKAAAIREARGIICISKATRDDLDEFVGVRSDQNVAVIHLGASEQFRPIEARREGRPFVLFVGLRDGYKNFATVAQALGKLPDVDLRCVGGGDLKSCEIEMLSAEVRRRIRYLGVVSDAELNRLYNQAVCLVYPSRYEGFGMPVVEAMRAGCPVVSIHCAAVMEVGSDALVLSEDDPEAIAGAISKVMEPQFRARIIQKGLAISSRYDWETCYRKTVEVYRQCAQ